MFDYSQRVQKARDAMKDKGLDGLLLTSTASVFYFSGVTASSPPGLVISQDSSVEPILICRGHEYGFIADQADWEVVGADSADPMGSVNSVIQQLGLSNSTLGFEDTAMSHKQGVQLEQALSQNKLQPASTLVGELRLVKDQEEIDYMKKAGQVSDEAMMAAVNTLKDGESETMAAAAAESKMREHGMFVAYETLIGSGFRSGLLRRFPDFTVPGPDDIIKSDLAARYSFAAGYGYHTDQTRSLTTGKPSKQKLEVLEATKEVQKATLNALEPGKTIRDVSLEGLAVVKGTQFEEMTVMAGHGIGLDISEWPPFNEHSTIELVAGQCYAIEPHIVIPGEHTGCFEDTVAITSAGYEPITNLPFELWG